MLVRCLRIDIFKVLVINLQYCIAVTSVFWPNGAQPSSLHAKPSASILKEQKTQEKDWKSVPQETHIQYAYCTYSVYTYRVVRDFFLYTSQRMSRKCQKWESNNSDAEVARK